MTERKEQDDLYARGFRQERGRRAPLAYRMRPRDFSEFVGQAELLAPGRALRQAIEEDRLSSFIIQGPPGSGKTALAELIARKSRSVFIPLNAAEATTAEVRRIIREARDRLVAEGRRTILFLDELHRFNRAQQDSLLEALEDGSLQLIGATTENPFYTLNRALLSRVGLYRFSALDAADLNRLLDRALSDSERGLGPGTWELDPAAREELVTGSGGDARALLNALEAAAQTTRPGPDGVRRITAEAARGHMQRPYDRQGDLHYDHASAFIKSLRGSDSDASLYYLVRMLDAGEDPRFIARRLVIQAAEDVGLADPRALSVAVAAAQALEIVGLPEARLALAEAAVYLALAPKSNSITAALEALDREFRRRPPGEVPPHLRSGAGRSEPAEPYLYPHDFPGHHVEQVYLPPGWEGSRFYFPGESGEEPELAARRPGLRLDRRGPGC